MRGGAVARVDELLEQRADLPQDVDKVLVLRI